MRIVFMGTPDFSVPILERLITDHEQVVCVVTQPDRKKGRKKVLTPPPVKVAAEKHDIPVFQPERIKDQQEINQILQYKPDLIVTAAFGQILPKEILDYPKYGCINVHASLLPELRGGAPIHYAILQGKKKTGVTIMYMVERLDAGDILSQVEVDIAETDHVGSLHDKLSIAGTALLIATIPKLIDGRIKPVVQDEKLATFAQNIKRDQERINWSQGGNEIYNQIRGLNPWPVAFTTYQGNVLKIWWGEKVVHDKEPKPGTIMKIEDDGFIVSTADQIAIKITELQPSGKKIMSGEAFLRGAGSVIKLGERLGFIDE